MANFIVIGATGDVGRGIVSVLLERGHRVAGLARTTGRLEALQQELGEGALFHGLSASVESDATAEAAVRQVRAVLPSMDGIVVSVSAPRKRGALLSYTSNAVATLICTDLVSHFTAARAFLPALADGGVYIGIGGGSADFVLSDGAYMSIAQAGLRMMHRALAHELRDQPMQLRQLTIASVVNGASTAHCADPAWVTDREVGTQAAAMLEQPEAFPDPVWRIGRRDQTGRPVVTSEGQTLATDLPLGGSDLASLRP